MGSHTAAGHSLLSLLFTLYDHTWTGRARCRAAPAAKREKKTARAAAFGCGGESGEERCSRHAAEGPVGRAAARAPRGGATHTQVCKGKGVYRTASKRAKAEAARRARGVRGPPARSVTGYTKCIYVT